MKKICTKAYALLVCALLLVGCGTAASPAGSGAASGGGASSGVSGSVTAVNIDPDYLFSSRDLEQGYDAAKAIAVQLAGNTAVCASDAVTVDGGRITIRQQGVYVVSGTLTNGQIVVDAEEDAKVQLVLSGAGITSADSAAIYCKEADKVFITLAEGTENTLANGGRFADAQASSIDAVIFSKTDLTMNGTGSLTVESPAGHGVVSKDELTVTGGSYTITAANHGFAGKDSIAVADGSFAVTTGKDGFHAEDADDEEHGFFYAANGSFVVDAQGDAISAGTALRIDGGSYTLTAGGGSASVTMKAGGAMGPGQRGNTAGQGTADESAQSCKGIKAGGNLAVNGGTFVLDTADDAVHAGGDVTITGGSWTIRTGDDGLHADGTVTIDSGSFSILYCYEGVEGQTVNVNGGTLEITAYDDGINAAGGSDGSGTAFGFGKQDPFAADETCAVTITGGTITIVSDGDCIDSNGSLTITGGVLDLTCSGNGNTALDASGTYSRTGGDITTNDGSENGTGGRGGMGDRMPGGIGERPDGAGGGKRPAADPDSRSGATP